MPAPTSLPRLPEHLEAELLRFDASWNKPGVEQLRAAYPSEANDAYLLELIHIDAQKRVAAGLTAEEALYLEAFPVLLEKAALLQKVREITFTPMQAGDSVLRALAATTPVLHQVNLPAIDPQATTSESPSTLPEHRYKLEGEIARGGMGAVLRGRDEDLGREIAVKVMLQNHAGKTELLQRFVEEAQIAGQLQHPGITPVYELGRFPDQRPYFTMKLVRGQTLAKLLKDRAGPTSERPRFLKIFEQICQTLAYAHTRKVIHRDLKPHNIMVGSFGEVQVMDWGLAKVLTTPPESGAVSARPTAIPETSEGSVQTKRSSGNSTDIPNTQAGSVLGTPAYMAPEQARGDIEQLDERADVFGLGAILCEILTGQPPYIGESGFDIYRKAVDAELADAIRRLEQCGADRELISLAKRCLSVNREDRPRDASELSKNLANYLHSVEDRLKQAELTAVKATTKAEEESKRRRITIQLASGILFTLVAGLLASLWQMNRAIEAEGVAKTNEEKAVQLASSEKAAKEQTQRRLLQIEKGVELLAGMLKGLDPKAEEMGAPPLYEQLRERAEKMADHLNAESVGDPLAVARLQTILGSSLNDLGNASKAIEVLQRAHMTRVRELGAEHIDTLDTLSNQATALHSAGKLAEALKILEHVNEVLARNVEPDHHLSLAVSVEWANVLRESGRLTEATRILEKVRDALKKHNSDHPETLAVLNSLAVAYRAAGDLPTAIQLHESIRNDFMRQKGPDHPDTLANLNNLASAYRDAYRLPEAIPLLERIRDIQVKKLGGEHPGTITALNNLAGAYRTSGKLTDSIKMFEHAQNIAERMLGHNHPKSIATRSNLAGAYHDAGKLSDAIRLFNQAIDASVATLGANHPSTLSIQCNLASVYVEDGKIAEAIAVLEHIRPTLVKHHGADHHITLNALSILAGAYLNAQKYPEAVKLYEQVRDLEIKKHGGDYPSSLITQCNLAVAYQKSGKLSESILLLEQILPSVKIKLGPDHTNTLSVYDQLARSYQITNRLPEAIKMLEECRNIRVRTQGVDNIDTLATQANLALVYRNAKKFNEAIAVYEQIRGPIEQKLGHEHKDTLNTLHHLAGSYREVGRMNEATALYEQVRKVYEKKLGANHVNTIITMNNLAGIYFEAGKKEQALMTYEQVAIALEKLQFVQDPADLIIPNVINAFEKANRYDLAEKWQRKWLNVIKARSGPDSITYAGELALLGMNLLALKKWNDAETVLRDCLVIREKKQSDAWTTFNTQSQIGGALLGQGKYKEAEVLLLKGYEGMKRQEQTIPQQGKRRLTEALDRLIQLYTETNNPNEVMKWKAEKAKYPQLSPVTGNAK